MRWRKGGLDVLAQHVLGVACAAPFAADSLFAEVKSATPYRHLTREDFDKVVDFVATGGYALKRYDRYAHCGARRRVCGGSPIRASVNNIA